MHMHNQMSHTTFFVRCFFDVCVRFMCDVFSFFFFHLLCVCFFAIVLRFLKETHKKIKKNSKKRNTKQNKCKGKDQNVFDRICFAFDCMCFCICCAFLLHLLCLVCACFLHCLCVFLHLFSGHMRFVFAVFFAFFWHSKASFGDLFLRFLCIFFRDWFCIIFALVMHFLFFAVSSELALAYIITVYCVYTCIYIVCVSLYSVELFPTQDLSLGGPHREGPTAARGTSFIRDLAEAVEVRNRLATHFSGQLRCMSHEQE